MSLQFGDPQAVDRQWLDSLHAALFAWFERSGRDFPWRHSSSPYEILVAEKLLQQTAARASVIQAYHAILDAYPTSADLAQADPTVLASIVRPLGLHYRAGELKTLALALQERFVGQVPSALDKLKSLPGVGDYTARAVQCFAFTLDVALVDTNIARLLFRLFGLPGPLPANPARHRFLLGLAGLMVPEGRCRSYNFALLDLCALVCTPKRPACGVCPVLSFCTYGIQQGRSRQGATGATGTGP